MAQKFAGKKQRHMKTANNLFVFVPKTTTTHYFISTP